VKHLFRIAPLEDACAYTDSESAIKSITKRYSELEITRQEKGSTRIQRLLTEIIELLKKRDAAGAKSQIRFVYSHLNDHNPHETEEEKKERNRKEKEMWETYGPETEWIIEGNKQADLLTKGKASLPTAAKHSPLDPEFIVRIDERDQPQKVRAALYANIMRAPLEENRKKHPLTYDWMKSEEIHKKASAMLAMDTNRKLKKVRNFQFKLRNNRLKTMESMNKRYQASRGETRYAKTILSKYTSNLCPVCKASCEGTEHLTTCTATKTKREETQALIIKTILKEIKSASEEEKKKAATHLESAIVTWLTTPLPNSKWQPKWAWFGYISKPLQETLEKQTWAAEQNWKSITKKIQLIVTEALNECWVRRCKALHNKQVNEEQLKLREKRTREQCEGVKCKAGAVQRKSQETHRVPFTSMPHPRQPEPQNQLPIQESDSSQEEPPASTAERPGTNNAMQRAKQKRKERSPRREMQSIYDDAAEAAAAALGRVATAALGAAATTEADEDALLTPLWNTQGTGPPSGGGSKRKAHTEEVAGEEEHHEVEDLVRIAAPVAPPSLEADPGPRANHSSLQKRQRQQAGFFQTPRPRKREAEESSDDSAKTRSKNNPAGD
jgi:hypothetical protein